MRALLNSHVIGPSQLLHTLVTYGPSGNVAILGPVAAGTDLPDLPRVFPLAVSVFLPALPAPWRLRLLLSRADFAAGHASLPADHGGSTGVGDLR